MIIRSAVAGAAVVAASATGDRSSSSSQLRQSTTCSWGALGTSFDLSPTHHTTAQGVYQVPDIRDATTKYYFNPCDSVAVPDPICTSGGRSGNNGSSTGWQIESPAVGSPTCYRLGGALAGGWNFSFFGAFEKSPRQNATRPIMMMYCCGAPSSAKLDCGMISLAPTARLTPPLPADINYPNRGVVLTYGGGESTWCPGYGPSQQSRTLSLELTCDPTVDPASATYAAGLTVREENTCDYRVQVPSLAGCPLECQTGKNLCNGHGVCGYNTDAQRSQCYCFNNWAGARCETGACYTVIEYVHGFSFWSLSYGHSMRPCA